jgi:membrane-bound lytic murein transglycosylase A
MTNKFAFISLSLVLGIVNLYGCTSIEQNKSLGSSVVLAQQGQLLTSVAIPQSDTPMFDLPAPIWLPLLPVREVAFTVCCRSKHWGFDEQLWGQANQAGDRQALLQSIDYSLRYVASGEAATAYKRYRLAGVGITRDRVLRSLKRFRVLVQQSRSPVELQAAVQREFVFYQSIGKDGFGNVLFTAYFEPIYSASRVPTPEYRYPIYRLPPDLSTWPKPHPTREQLEGKDGLQAAQGKLRGLELFWLRDRLEAYQIHIQGSAQLQLPDGSQTTVGYAGNTAYNYKSLGRALIDDGKLPQQGVTMPIILQYFQQYPQELDNYIPRDRSFVFFRENHGRPAMGSVNVPLTAERSIATDKALMPPGAIALIHAPFPFVNASGQMEQRMVSRYVLDQDTGGAIKGAGRVDYFLGTGQIAGDRAGLTVSNGQLYYLLLRQ